MLSFSGITLVLFRFRLFAFTEAVALRSIVLRSVLRYACVPTVTRSYLTTVCVLFRFCFSGNVAFSEYFCFITVFSLYKEYVVCFFSFRMVFFYHVTTGWIYYISLYENSID